MSKVKIKLNRGGVGQLLKSGEMRDCVKGIADQMAQRCGTGYDSDSYVAGTRVIASVFTDTAEAAKDNSENNTLLKAVRT